VVGERGGKPYLSVVIPAYNEEDRLGHSLQRIAEYVDGAEIDTELLVVDDGSKDGTGRLATSALSGRRGRVLTNPENRGKGYSVRRGVLEATGSWVLMTDADLSSPIEEYAKLAQAARDHDLDVAFGSRALPDSDVQVHQHVVRESMGKTFNLLIRTMTGMSHRDTQCGFKLIDRRRTRPLFERMVIDRFAFDVELLFLCERFGLSVREVPVVWRNAAGLLGDPLNMLLDVARVRWRFRRGLYNPDVEPGADAGN
jgi:dolichyl-phosphate beta-glucosyltransferase